LVPNKESDQHKTIAARLNVDLYFAHAYASRERGTNENMNDLIH